MEKILVALCIVCSAASAAQAATILAKVRLQVEDLTGSPISSIQAGESFRLAMFAQDIRIPPSTFGGVFEAYAHVTYDPSLASVAGPLSFGPPFVSFRPGDFSVPGLIRGAGAFWASLSAPGTAEQRVWSLPFQATSPGQMTFVSSFDELGEFLLYGTEELVLEDEITFLTTSLSIVPEPSSIGLSAMAIAVLCGVVLRQRGASSKRSAL